MKRLLRERPSDETQQEQAAAQPDVTEGAEERQEEWETPEELTQEPEEELPAAAGKKRFLSRFGKPRRRTVILAAAAVVAVAAAAVFLWPKTPAAQEQQTVTRTFTLSRGSLEETVSVTGTVESTGVTNVSTTQTGAVTEIFVSEGSEVSEGDVLCTLDDEDLQDQLEQAQKNYNDAVTSAQEAYDKAVASRTEAYDNSVAAESNVTSTLNTLNAANAKFETAKSSVATYQSAYDAALAAEQAAGAALNEANAALAADPSNAELQAAQASAQSAHDVAKQTLNTAQQSLESAKQTCSYDALSAEQQAAQQAYDAARQSLTQLENTYKQADESVQTAEKNLKTAKENTTEIESLNDKIEDCTVKAPSDGTVTTVNAVVGSAAANGTPLFVLQDTSSLKVVVQVDEDDIQKLSTGMTARITSDVTDSEATGTLTNVSLTATNGSFTAEVTVNGADTGLLIGTNAKVKIVLSELEDVWSVPIDAVGTDEDGNSVIYVKEGDEFVPMVVTTGKETDYYVEITGDGLEDGLVVRASANAEEAEMDVTMPDGMAMGGMGMGGSVMISGDVEMAAPAEGGGRGGAPGEGGGPMGG